MRFASPFPQTQEDTRKVKAQTTAQTVEVRADGEGLVSHVGAYLLTELADRTALTAALSEAMAPTRVRRSAHDPSVVLRDLAVSIADGGDCVSDRGVLRGQEALFGAVASETTAHRVIKSIDADLLEAIRAATRDHANLPRSDHRNSPGISTGTGSKHHLLTDAGGLPLAITLTGGHRDDVTQLLPLVDGVAPIAGKVGRPRRRPDRLLADRGYDRQVPSRALGPRHQAAYHPARRGQRLRARHPALGRGAQLHLASPVPQASHSLGA
jgi:transposase